MENISFEDFLKIEIRIGRIESAKKIEGADKLLELAVDIGDEKRKLVAGIALQYRPEDLEGKSIPVLVNLEPRKIRGVESQGMILAADVEGKPVLIVPDSEVPAGTRIR